jgi:FlaA1/EpsC-like NDP-sugar epimerase
MFRDKRLLITGGTGSFGTAVLHRFLDTDVPNVSDKVVRIVHSYTDYVRRVVWRE